MGKSKSKAEVKKYYSTNDEVGEKKKETNKKLILHLRVNKKIEDFENPNPHEPEIINPSTENKLSKYSSNISEDEVPQLVVEPIKENNQIVINLMSDFIQGIDGQWPEKTNILCTWCCHRFDNIPCGIPEKLKNGKFYLTDCFCSFNCCASEIFYNVGYKKWEKYALLNLLYQKYTGKFGENVELALSKKLLTDFGGYMTISEFRKNLDVMDKKYNIILPPIVSIIPKVEILKNNCIINDFNSIQWNTKPSNINNKNNSLTAYMNIRSKDE